MRIGLSSSAILVCISAAICSGAPSRPVEQSSEISAPQPKLNPVLPNQPLAQISYRAVGNLIYVPVQINGSATLWFNFDTGAPNSLIDQAAAEKLDIHSLSSGVIHGAAKGDVSASDAGAIQFTVGGLNTKVSHAKIVDLSKVPVSAKMDGLLGAEYLEQYVVRIDPAQHTIAFYDPKSFVYQGDGGWRTPSCDE